MAGACWYSTKTTVIYPTFLLHMACPFAMSSRGISLPCTLTSPLIDVWKHRPIAAKPLSGLILNQAFAPARGSLRLLPGGTGPHPALPCFLPTDGIAGPGTGPWSPACCRATPQLLPRLTFHLTFCRQQWIAPGYLWQMLRKKNTLGASPQVWKFLARLACLKWSLGFCVAFASLNAGLSQFRISKMASLRPELACKFGFGCTMWVKPKAHRTIYAAYNSWQEKISFTKSRV